MSDDLMFVPAGPRSEKVSCAVCGVTGYPGGAWQDTHRRGHAPAPCCGKLMAVLVNGKPRRHTRRPAGCPGTRP